MNNLRQIMESVNGQRADDATAVLATVVEVSGSSYRRPGARMLLTQDNERCGMISGGCLERDLALKAWSLTEHGACTVAYDTRGRLEQPAGDFGAGCDGVVHVLLQRVDPHHDPMLKIIESVITDRQVAHVATVYRIPGSPDLTTGLSIGQHIHAEQPIRYNGSRASCPLSAKSAGGMLTAESIRHAIELRLARPSWQASTFTLRLQVGEDQLASVDILMERIEPVPRLVIFGAGDDAVPLDALAQATGWETTVWDRRETLLCRSRFAGLTFTGPPQEVVQKVRLTAADYIILMTHDLDDDATLLSQLVRQPVNYIGILGPKRRAAKLMTELHRRNQLPTTAQLDKTRTPIGLDIGAEGAEEIAVSILAEVIAHRNSRPGASLHQRGRPIHHETPTEIEHIQTDVMQVEQEVR